VVLNVTLWFAFEGVGFKNLAIFKND
jgi:hypothetical protein